MNYKKILDNPRGLEESLVIILKDIDNRLKELEESSETTEETPVEEDQTEEPIGN